MISFTSSLLSVRRTVLVASIALLVMTFVVLVAANKEDRRAAIATSAEAIESSAGATVKTKFAERFGMLPLSFERNAGQSDEAVKFLSRGPGYELFLTATEAVLTLQKPHAPQFDEFKRPLPPGKTTPEANVREGSVLRLKMIGANPSPQVEGQDELLGKVNYLTGSEPEKWRRNIPTYRRVLYKDVYPGIDVLYYGNSQRELEYDLNLTAGADPKQIRFSIEGAEGIRLDKSGDLLLKLKHGEVSLKKPVIYQLTKAGDRREVKGS